MRAFPNNASMPSPVKTIKTANHCLVVMALPKKSTEKRMVKNFRVVVTTDVVRGPNDVTVVKMKF